MKNQKLILTMLPILFAFFVMGFVDFVGIAMNYVKQDFSLSDTVSSAIPMMVFVWFLVLSIPIGMLAGKIGYKKTILIGLAITLGAMLLPLIHYSFAMMLLAFALLGIGNTVLQVCLNPLVGCLVDAKKMASVLTLGQFIKAISSFLGPILVSMMASLFCDWLLVLFIYGGITIVSALWFWAFVTDDNEADGASSVVTFSSLRAVINDKSIIAAFVGILLICGVDLGLNIGIPQLIMAKLGWTLATAGLGTSVYFAARTIGTFLGTFILMKCSPVKFLIWSMILTLVAFAVMLTTSIEEVMLVMIVIIGLMCANVFSIIFSKALNHKRDHMKEVSSFMIMGVCGGAIVMPIMGFLSDHMGIAVAMCVLVACVVYLLMWAVVNNKKETNDK